MDSQVNSPDVSALQELPRALVALAEALGLEEPFSKGERLLHLDTEVEFPLARLNALDAPRRQGLRRLFGDALSLAVLHQEEVIVAASSDGVTTQEHQSLLRTFGSDEKLTLRFNLDKSKLLEHHGLRGVPQVQRLLLYVFADRLPYFLSRDLEQCEADLWGENSHAQVVILVCDQEFYLTGHYLTICGGSHLAQWERLLRESPSEPVSDVGVCASKMNAVCRDNLRWDKKWVQRLTPLHFKCENQGAPESSELSRVLALQRMRLSLLYSADNTLEIQDQISSVYQGNQTPVRVAWPEVAREAQQQRARVGFEVAAQRMTSLIEWIYEPTWPVDRLLLTQLYLANEMRACDPQRAFDFLLDNIERIEGDLKSRWKDFIAKKLDGYSEQERAFEDDITKTTQAFAEQIAGMIKSLTESGLAAAVAIIGSFLGSFYSTPFNGFLFAWGLRIFAAYVLIFPALLGLSYGWGQFRALRHEFAARRARIEERLDAQRVENIVKNSRVAINEMRFKCWMGTAAAIYLLLIVSALWGASYLPPLISPGK